MRILYISTIGIELNEKNLYSDLIYESIEVGHEITLIDDFKNKDIVNKSPKLNIVPLSISVFSIKNRYIKGILALYSEKLIISCVKKNLKHENYDLILYATPPHTYSKVVKYCKKIYKCKSYLMLKDIFPQNAVDEGLINNKGPLFRYLRYREKQLYNISDKIGCMSQGNIDYLLKNNPEIDRNKIEIFHNCERIKENNYVVNKEEIRDRYNIPREKVVFVFGGNIGIAQGIKELIESIKTVEDLLEAYFLIVGNGSEVEYVKKEVDELKNVQYISRLSRDNYEELLMACDVGIISLGNMYTIPNYPSRILTYMQCKVPIMALTDNVTDIRELIEKEAKCGYWSYSGDVKQFKVNVEKMCGDSSMRTAMGQKGFEYCKENFNCNKEIEKLEQFTGVNLKQ